MEAFEQRAAQKKHAEEVDGEPQTELQRLIKEQGLLDYGEGVEDEDEYEEGAS